MPSIPRRGRERPLFLLSDLPTPPGQSQGSTASPSTHIAFAPDFSRLAMAIEQNGVPNLWVASLRDARPDGRLVQRTFEREGGTYPAWSPDGRWIAYQCHEGTDTHVCVTGAEHGDRLQLTHEAGAAELDRRLDSGQRPRRLCGAPSRSMERSDGLESTSKVQTLTPFTTPRLIPPLSELGPRQRSRCLRAIGNDRTYLVG